MQRTKIETATATREPRGDGSITSAHAVILCADTKRVLVLLSTAWSIPGGLCERDEAHGETARHELQEECGLPAGRENGANLSQTATIRRNSGRRSTSAGSISHRYPHCRWRRSSSRGFTMERPQTTVSIGCRASANESALSRTGAERQSDSRVFGDITLNASMNSWVNARQRRR